MYGLGIAKGMLVVLKHLFRRPFTRQYPEEPVPLSPRFRGYDFALVLDRCTCNAACAKVCPHGCIDIVTSRQADGRYALEKFDIDVGKCMVCGLCVEVCPYDALFMGTSFELASYNRWDVVVHKEDIANRPSLSAYFRPPLRGEVATRETIDHFYAPTPGLEKPQEESTS
jgi:NADH-quinone oxidoreductase chain I